MHIRIDDVVEVIAGDDRGVRGKVLKVIPRKGKILVEAVNRVYKHVRRSQKNPQGGRLSKEMPINVSNALLIDPQTGQPTRIGIRLKKDGTKERYAKKSGASLGDITTAKS